MKYEPRDVAPVAAGQMSLDSRTASVPTQLKVLMMPDGRGGNPYQRALVEGLESENVRVAFSQFHGRLPLLHALRQHGPVDVMHLHWTHRLVVGRSMGNTLYRTVRFLAELAIIRLRGIRIVWTAHNLVDHEKSYSSVELFANALAARFYNGIIVHCPSASEIVSDAFKLPASYARKFTAIPHGSFIGIYDDSMTREEARARLQLEENAPVFIHFGQIREYKGAFDLLDAFEKLDAPHARLVIAGKPWDENIANRLQERARRDPRVRVFLGFVPDELVQCYLKAADVVVLPYQDILTSGSAILAMSFGKTVIMPRCGFAVDTFGEKDAVLYDPEHKGALHGALAEALGRDLAEMGAACLRRAESYDWPGVSKSTAAVYRKL